MSGVIRNLLDRRIHCKVCSKPLDDETVNLPSDTVKLCCENAWAHKECANRLKNISYQCDECRAKGTCTICQQSTELQNCSCGKTGICSQCLRLLGDTLSGMTCKHCKSGIGEIAPTTPHSIPVLRRRRRRCFRMETFAITFLLMVVAAYITPLLVYSWQRGKYYTGAYSIFSFDVIAAFVVYVCMLLTLALTIACCRKCCAFVIYE